jgi:hypothetical protein
MTDQIKDRKIKGGTRKGITKSSSFYPLVQKGKTPHWRQRTDTNLSTNEERRSTTARQPYSTSEAHDKPQNHTSRDTFNITESRDTFTNVTEK